MMIKKVITFPQTTLLNILLNYLIDKQFFLKSRDNMKIVRIINSINCIAFINNNEILQCLFCSNNLLIS